MSRQINQELLEKQILWSKEVAAKVLEKSNDQLLSQIFSFGVSEEYFKSDKDNRIMLVGQEAHCFGKYDKAELPDGILSSNQEWAIGYMGFQLQQDGWKKDIGKYAKNHSPFWEFFRGLKKRGYVPAWNNIDKLHGYNRETGDWERLARDDRCALNNGDIDGKTLFWHEVNIARPQKIVFLTGPNYQASMQAALGKDLSGYAPSTKSLCNRIAACDDLEIEVYWTYHPAYLQRIHKLDEVIAGI